MRIHHSLITCGGDDYESATIVGIRSEMDSGDCAKNMGFRIFTRMK